MIKSSVRISVLAAAFGVALVAVGAANAQNAASPLDEGDIVISRLNLNVRADAGMDAERIGRVPRRSFGMVVSGPEQANNRDWYEIEWVNGLSGWSDSRYLVKKAPSGTALPTIEEPNGGETLTLGQNTAIEIGRASCRERV